MSEPNLVAALASIDQLGLLRALPAELSFDEEAAHEALALLSEAGADTRPDLLLLAMMLAPGGYPIYYSMDEQARRQIARLLNDLEFSASDRDLMLNALTDGPAIANRLAFAETPSAIRKAASRASLEAVALVGAPTVLSADGPDNVITEAARRWLAELHSVRLLITGEDLRAAGVPEGPEVGRRLEVALSRKLDGELTEGRQAELQAAMEA